MSTKYEDILKNVGEYREKKLISEALKENILKILNVIDQSPKLSTREKNSLLANVWNILKLNRNYGFVFDYAPSQISNTPALHYLKADTNKTINASPLDDKNQNHLIISENYYALQNLLVAGFRSKVDIIYIDPPYNTKEMQSYADKFGRDGWLSMMKERLELAKELLSDDGVIFVSIDDSEQAYLKVLMDEIFGEKNFVTNIIRKTRSILNRLKNNINVQHEYCLLYAKADQYKAHGTLKDFKNYSNADDDPKGAWVVTDPSIGLVLANGKPNDFPVKNPLTGDSDCPPVNRQWQFTQKRLQDHIESGKIIFRKNPKPGRRGFIYKRYQNEINSKTNVFNSLQFAPQTCQNHCQNNVKTSRYMNQTASKNFRNLGFEQGDFFYPKPVLFIKELISFLGSQKKDSLILDFFAGTGTSGHAVMDLNREERDYCKKIHKTNCLKNCGERKFILVTNNENDIDQICYKRLHLIMTGKGTKGENDFEWLRKNKPFKNESLNYYNTIQRNITLNETTPNQQEISKILSTIQETYRRLGGDAPEITTTNWFNLLFPLLTNANIKLQDKKS